MRPNKHSLRFRLGYLAWQGVAHFLVVPGLLYLLWRGRREPTYRRGILQRFGRTARQTPGAVWVFAASAGETKAVGPLIDRLLARGHRVVLTHSTPAGLETAGRLFADQPNLTVGYAPLDLFWAVQAFLSRARPALLVVVEIELWPAMLIETARRGVPLAHVNANLVERSISRDQARFGGARMALYSLFDVICTKTDAFAARFRQVGVNPARVQVVGELKFDQPVSAAQTAAATHLRAHWSPDRPVLTIASSVEGEEPAFLALVLALQKLNPTPRVVWVPRSPQRFNAVARLCAANGLRTDLRSKTLNGDLNGTPGGDILIGDSLGEMDFYIGLCDLTVVGASLVDHGGHNIMEPLSQGKPVLMGPSVFGIRFAADAATAAGAFQSLPDADALTARCAQLLSDDPDLARMTQNARAFTAHHTGAADLTLAALTPFLPKLPG